MNKLISTNPSRNHEVLGEVESSTHKEVLAKVSKAKKIQPLWNDLSLKDRCAKISTWIAVVDKRKDEIAELITKETGRQIDASRGNVAGFIEYLNSYLEIAEKHLAPQVTQETDNEIHTVYREPWGVVAAICPWNYPMMNVAWQCGQALIAGNTIVYKNSEKNPLFAQLLAETIEESNLPEGVFNVLYGDAQVGEWIVDANVDMISFTGSTQTGQKLAIKAAEKFIPIVAELGGSAPLVLFEDVEVDDFVEHVYNRRFKVCGQACDAVKRLIVHESKYGEMIEKLVALIEKQKVGDAMDKDTEIGPLIDEMQLRKLEHQVEDSIKAGATIETGGKRPENLEGSYYLPTVLTNVKQNMRVWKEETFGPVLPVVIFKTEEEAIHLANNTEYGLGAHIITHDKARFHRVARQIDSGMIAQNKVMYWSPDNPFGGYKKSGMGRIHGEFGFHDVTQIKLVSEEK